MATAFTKTTEMSVAFGLLGVHPLESSFDLLVDSFSNTLDQNNYNIAIKEFKNVKKAKKYDKLWILGQEIRRNYFEDRPVTKVEWLGLHKQRKTVSVSKDLSVNNYVYISVKSDSNIVFNLSPHNLLQALPSGSPMASKEANWFLRTAPDEYEELYQFVKSHFPRDYQLPLTVLDFEKSGKGVRKDIQKWLDDLDDIKKTAFERLYVCMCHEVAIKSANLFSDNRRNIDRRQLGTANELILKHFLRLNSTPYLLAGLDGGESFAVEVPDITKWFQNWNLLEIEAKADTNRGQCIVNFVLKLTNRQNNQIIELPYHSEIRWSHGKFCGNPEGKLYKDFKWREVPFFKKVI